MTSRNKQIGRAGEYHVASVLELAGIEATKLDGTFDLLAVTPHGTIISIEVKTATKTAYADLWRFGRGAGYAQWFALYCMPLGVVRFYRADDVRHTKVMFNVRSAEFNDADAADDLATLLAL